MSTRSRVFSVLWLVFGLCALVARLVSLPDQETFRVVYYAVIGGAFFIAAAIVIAFIGVKFRLPIPYWNFSEPDETACGTTLMCVTEKKGFNGLYLLIALTVVSLAMGFFGLSIDLEGCFPYYVIGIVGSLFFGLLILHSNSFRIMVTDRGLMTRSEVGWSGLSWAEIGSIEFLSSTTKPKRDFYGKKLRDFEMSETSKYLLVLDSHGKIKIKFGTERLDSGSLNELVVILKDRTNLEPNARNEEHTRNDFL